MKSLVFFLVLVLFFQTVTFSPLATAQSSEEIKIPSWFKTNAKWWKEDRISDTEILNAIENLLNQGVIKLDSNKIKSNSSSSIPSDKDNTRIPSYVKQIFVLWEEGAVSDSDISNALKFLIEEKIIKTQSATHNQPRPLAAIIDQLHDTIPNQDFSEKAQLYLERAGYKVDFYTTENITLNFYKNLPSMNYKYILIRTHSLEEPKLNNATFLFTGEKYDVNKYFMEQISGQLGKGAPIYEEQKEIIEKSNENLDERMYFLVGTKFVDELMVGKFPDSVILIGGCESLRNKDLAKSFLSRGALDVIGWDRTVGANENDKIMLAFLERTLVDKKKIDDTVIELNDEFSQELKYSSKLHHAYRIVSPSSAT